MRRTASFLCVLVLTATGASYAAIVKEVPSPNEIVTRTYPTPAMFPSHVSRATDVKKQLEEGGIVFTEGTSVGFDDESSLIVVTHRYSVQPQVRQILKAKGLLGGQVEQVTIEARFLKMSRTLAEKLFDDEGGLSKACFLNERILKRIMDLGRKGKIVELGRPKLTTVSGNTAQVKAVRGTGIQRTLLALCRGNV